MAVLVEVELRRRHVDHDEAAAVRRRKGAGALKVCGDQLTIVGGRTIERVHRGGVGVAAGGQTMGALKRADPGLQDLVIGPGGRKGDAQAAAQQFDPRALVAKAEARPGRNRDLGQG